MLEVLHASDARGKLYNLAANDGLEARHPNTNPNPNPNPSPNPNPTFVMHGDGERRALNIPKFVQNHEYSTE